MNDVVNSGIAVRLSLTLLHSLWEGTAISLLAAAVAGAFNRSAAAVRYHVYFAALILSALAALLTFLELPTGADAAPSTTVSRLAEGPSSATGIPQQIFIASSVNAASAQRATVAANSPPAALKPTILASLPVKTHFEVTRWAGPIAELYASGVILMLFRLALAIRADRRLRASADALTDGAIVAALERQAFRLGLSCVPALFQSTRVLVPTVYGILRPVILLPVSVSTGLSLQAIEAILAHELAHVRRHDHVLHLVQRLIEAAFFYHPAVWYLSKRIDAERENACDDVVVRGLYNPRDYAEALVQAAELCTLARWTGRVSGVAMASRRGDLRRRIARLLEPPANSPYRLPGVCTASIALSLGIVLAVGMGHRASAADPSTPAAASGTTIASTNAQPPEQKMHSLPTYSDAVDKVVLPENLKAAASRTTDPDVLLGLAYLAPAGSPVRQEISESALNGRGEYAPIAAVLAVAINGPTEQSVRELIKSDPDNALGYYLQANQLYLAGKDKESLALFEKAASCPQLHLYGTVTADALFKALDYLNLHGRDRLAALSWTATRMSNFFIRDLQSLPNDLSEMTVNSDTPTREKTSDLLLILGGQLFSTNFENREYAESSISVGYRVKAEIAAANNSPQLNGYFAVSQAIFNKQLIFTSGGDETQAFFFAARFLPSRIWGAFGVVSKSRGNNMVGPLGNTLELSDSDKAAYLKAQGDYVKAAGALIDVCLADSDGIVGAYLKDLPPPDDAERIPGVTCYTYVDRLMYDRPDVFKAAAANELAMRALWQAGTNDRVERNVSRLMQLDSAIWAYACDHDQNLPDSLEVLYKDKAYLKDASETKSLLTGKAFVFAAAGKKFPQKQADRDRFVVVYDADEVDGRYQCAFGNGGGTNVAADVFEQMLKKQGN